MVFMFRDEGSVSTHRLFVFPVLHGAFSRHIRKAEHVSTRWEWVPKVR